jgi:L-threonylcarbamoyladenylate synthase
VTERWPADRQSIERAAARLREGAVIAFPTDTLYAVAARATDAEAVNRLYAVKKRERTQPLVLLVRGLEDFGELGVLSADARDLIRRFWPGPLTLVVPSRAADGGTIAARAPDHPVALGLLRALNEPLASSSANRAGEPPPSDADSVMVALGDNLDVVLDGGSCPIARPSTILDLSGLKPRVLRAGAIAEADLGLP